MQDGTEVTGMVLSSMPVGEADRRVVLLTAELGRISAFARGARKPTSSLVSATRTFAFGKFTVFTGRNSYTLGKADVRDYFEEIVGDVERTAYGCYFAELSGLFSRENADGRAVLSLLYSALRALSRGKMPPALIRRVFELSVLHENGVLPDFSVCPDCGKPYFAGHFLKSRMQAVCTECLPEPAGIPLSRSALYALRFISGTPAEKLFSFTLSEAPMKELSDTADALLDMNLDREPKSLELLSVLGSEISGHN